MAKKTYVCPQCHVQVRDLKSHQARMHAEIKPVSEAKPESLKAKKLELDIKPKVKKAEPIQAYHCVSCGYTPISRGQSNCPQCGATFDWSQI